MFLLLFSSSPYRAKHVHISIILFGTNERVLKEEGDCDEVVSFLIVGSKKNLIFLC
jgi:hypothetical protein